ncbi:MAG: magnesium transporter [Candidatus Rariloculaceae bacterium]
MLALHPAEIADLLESLPPTLRRMAWELVAAASGLDLDDMADLLAELPEAINLEILRSLDASDRQRVEAVLRYDEDSAGGLMDPDTLTVRGDVTVEVVLRYLRLRQEIPDGTDAIFVVSRDGEYQGCLFISTLLTAGSKQKASELMDTERPAIEANTAAAEVVLIFETHDLLSAAVIDTAGALLGRITVDDVVDVIRQEADHSVLSMAGLDEEDDMFGPVIVSTRRRSVWLGVNLATAFIAAGSPASSKRRWTSSSCWRY